MLNFKKIELDDIEVYNHCFANNNEFSCENSFINLLIWQSVYNNMIAVNNNQIFIKSGMGACQRFKLPIGGDLKDGIKLIYEYCGKNKPSFWLQDGPRFREFKKIYGDIFYFKQNRNACDYIYLRDDLISLKGKKFHSKRNHINAFSKKFNWRYETISDKNVDKIRICAEKWYKENAEKFDKHMLCEKQGIETILSNMKKLSAKGGAIFINNDAVAFTLGSQVNKNVFDIHIEKALSEYSQAYAVINREFAKQELTGYTYINREDDLGLEGLRRAKLSYNPYLLLKKYYCTEAK